MYIQSRILPLCPDCSQHSNFSYFHCIVEHAERITREQDASAKLNTLSRKTQLLPWVEETLARTPFPCASLREEGTWKERGQTVKWGLKTLTWNPHHTKNEGHLRSCPFPKRKALPQIWSFNENIHATRVVALSQEIEWIPHARDTDYPDNKGWTIWILREGLGDFRI